MEKPHGACRVKLKQWALQRGRRSRPGSDCLYSGSGHERATEKKKKSALWRQISGSWLPSTVSGWRWVCCDGVTLGSGGWLFRVPLPLASGSLSAWFCQRTGDLGGGGSMWRRLRGRLCQKLSSCEVYWRFRELERGHMFHFLSSYQCNTYCPPDTLSPKTVCMCSRRVSHLTEM